MSAVTKYLVLKPLKTYIVDFNVWREAFSDYFKIYEESDDSWIVGFEDSDDFDYNEPKIQVELTDDFNIKITGLEYSGVYHNKLYYGDTLIFDLPSGEYSNFGSKSIPLSLELSLSDSLLLYFLKQLTINVDTLATEDGVGDEIDASTETSPVTVVTPPSGKRISTRGVYLFSSSDAGEVEARYMNSGKLITKIYCNKFRESTLPMIHTLGDVDDPIGIYWSGLSQGSKILYVIRYKFI